MASIRKSSSNGNRPAFRTRGMSFVLVCVLMINVLLVAVAPMMRPEQATAQDSRQSKAEKADAAQTPDAAKTPKEFRPAETTAQATSEPESVLSHATTEGPAPQVAQSDAHNESVKTPPELAGDTPATGPELELAANTDNSANSVSPEVVAPESGNEAVAQSDRQSVGSPEEQSAELQPETTQSEISQPEITQPPLATAPTLLVVNPAESGGRVFYLVDGEVHSLAPGETHDLEAGRDHRIEFNRGENFGDSELVLNTGTYRFRVENNGWNLVAANSSVE